MDRSGGGRSRSHRLRDRLARMFRPGTLLRSTCNTSPSSSTPLPAAGASATTTTRRPPSTACSSSRALLLALDRDSFLASSRRDYVVSRTESFSTAVDRLHCRGAVVTHQAPPSGFSVDAPPPPLLDRDKEKSLRDRLVRKTAKMISNDPYGFCSSDDTDVVFSSDADDDKDIAGGCGGANSNKKLAGETLFSSSRSFSSDSSEFYASTTTMKKKNKSPAAPPNKPPPLPPSSGRRRTRKQQRRRAASSCDTCGVRDGFAVVKRSRDPYADFRSSMVEMIVGRQLVGAPELERLLRSYLSLNAPRHHPVILQAFSDIWVVLHGG